LAQTSKRSKWHAVNKLTMNTRLNENGMKFQAL
jgi:hypothetical protein